MQTPIQYTFKLILKLCIIFQVNLRNLMSEGLSTDSFLTKLVSVKVQVTFIASWLRWTSSHRQERLKRRSVLVGPSRIRGNKIETHILEEKRDEAGWRGETRLQSGLATAFAWTLKFRNGKLILKLWNIFMVYMREREKIKTNQR